MMSMNSPVAELGHVPISPRDLIPCPANDLIYQQFDVGNPDDADLIESVREHGILEPLTATRDHILLSGHRRREAAIAAGLDVVPVRVRPYDYDDERVTTLLTEYNRQRSKSLDEMLNEEIARVDPDEAYEALCSARAERAENALPADTIRLRGHRARASISNAKRPFLDAIRGVIAEREAFWPLSDRQVHYALMNDPPLIHASKPDSRYGNSLASYKALCELLTRARLQGEISMDVIADETRPVFNWSVWPDAQAYVTDSMRSLLTGYWRNRQQSQPNHVEVVGEKNTLSSILKPVCAEHCIPLTLGRGYCSLAPRAAIADRFQRSGKDNLVLLIVSDFDPDGESIAESLARSMRDDFGVVGIHPKKVALTYEQTQTLDLPPALEAKTSSRQYQQFAEKYGNDVWEVEALPPEKLQALLRDAVAEVLDLDLYNAEVEREREEAAFLAETRQRAMRAMGDA